MLIKWIPTQHLTAVSTEDPPQKQALWLIICLFDVGHWWIHHSGGLHLIALSVCNPLIWDCMYFGSLWDNRDLSQLYQRNVHINTLGLSKYLQISDFQNKLWNVLLLKILPWKLIIDNLPLIRDGWCCFESWKVKILSHLLLLGGGTLNGFGF